MSTVTPAFVQCLATALDLTLRPDGTVRSGEKVVHRLPLSPDGKFRSEAYFDFIEWARQQQPDRVALVAACARALDLDNLNVLGLALKTSPTVRACLRRLERYFCLLTDTAVYRLEEGAQGATFRLEHRTLEHPALALRNECALAGVMHQVRLLVPDAPRFDSVSFRHPCEGDLASYEAFFQTSVEFEAEQDAITIASATLDSPTKLGDLAVSEFITGHLEREMDQTQGALLLKTEILRRLTASLSSGVPSAADLAQDLCMSERTLFRRLADEGTTLRDVVREAQIGLSRALLDRSDCSLAEVAFLSGFAEQSSFGRAFKRSVGKTPAQYRSAGANVRRADANTVLAGYAQTLAGSDNTGLSTLR